MLGEVGDVPVRVVGRARSAGKTLIAPLSDRPCVAFRLRITETRGRQFGRTVLDLRGGVPFLLADESGVALIEAEDTRRMALVPDLTGTIGGYRQVRPEAEAGLHVFSLLEAHGTNTETWLGFERRYSFEEGILGADGQVAVGGVAAREPYPDGERPTTRMFPERLVFRDTPGCRLSISTFSRALGGLVGGADAQRAARGL